MKTYLKYKISDISNMKSNISILLFVKIWQLLHSNMFTCGNRSDFYEGLSSSSACCVWFAAVWRWLWPSRCGRSVRPPPLAAGCRWCRPKATPYSVRWQRTRPPTAGTSTTCACPARCRVCTRTASRTARASWSSAGPWSRWAARRAAQGLTRISDLRQNVYNWFLWILDLGQTICRGILDPLDFRLIAFFFYNLVEPFEWK